MDSLKGPSLVEVAELIIKGVKEGSHHALELFPKLISVISSHKMISYRKGMLETAYFSCGTCYWSELETSICPFLKPEKNYSTHADVNDSEKS